VALKGFLSAENYTVITIDAYDKQEKRLVFIARTFTDSTKVELLSETTFNATADMAGFRTVISKDITSVPENPVEGDSYIVGSTSEAPFNGMEGCVAVCGENPGDWMFFSIVDGECTYVTDEDMYYMRKDGSWMLPSSEDMTPAKWDLLFDPNIFEAAGANLIQAIYTYLKTTPQFSHTVDA